MENAGCFALEFFYINLIELTAKTRLLETFSQNYAFVILRDKIFYKQWCISPLFQLSF